MLSTGLRFAICFVIGSPLLACGSDEDSGTGGGKAPPPGVIVFGQPDAVTNDAVRLGLGLPNDVAIVGSKLLVADQNNSRVLVYNSIPTQNHAAADLVLGQPDFTTGSADYGGVGPRGFRGTNAIASDGTHLIVADRFNNRVLIWNTFPTENFQAADVVLGQPDFTTSTPNTGGVSAQSLTDTWVWLCGQRLFVSDRNNARVLVYNSIPTQNHAPADLVLGQPDMTSATANNGGLNERSIADPGRGFCDGNRLVIPDLANHRVLIWDTLPTQSFAPANRVLGQADMLTQSPNAGAATVNRVGFNQPIATFVRGDTLAVADYSNNRVLLWTSPITQNGQAADVVIGQADGTSGEVNGGGAVTAATLYNPNALTSDGTRLLVCDRFNHRILIYSTLPTSDGASADIAIGQPDLVSGRYNNPGPVSASTLGGPASLTRIGERLAVAEFENSRVMLWDTPPRAGTDLPSLVLGQPDFESFGQFENVPSPQSLCMPFSVQSDGTRLLVGEQCSRRVAIWNAPPTSIQQALDLVVGQPNPTSAEINTGGLSASTFSNGPRAHSDGMRLFAADPQNHRVLIWSSLPTTNGAPANVVLGQPDMTSSTLNNGGLDAGALQRPTFVYVHGDQLFVADTGNNRVLVWNTVPTANRTAADLVLGQPNMTSNAAVGPSAQSLTAPGAVHVDAGGRLYVVDAANHRILYWHAIPTRNQAPADGVIGQPNLDTGLANNGGLSASTLQSPSGVLDVGDVLYVTDMGNHRLLVMPRP
jgi:hypothetical protein